MAGVHSCEILAGSSHLLLVVRNTGLVGVAAPGRQVWLRDQTGPLEAWDSHRVAEASSDINIEPHLRPRADRSGRDL